MSHTRLTRRSALWLAPATLGAASLGLATLGGARPARAAPVAFKITVSSNSLAYGGMHIALSAGLFEKHGLAPQVVVMHSGNAATAALISGSAPFASSGVGEVLAARVRGQDVVIVANLYHGLLGSVVLAKSVADKLKTKVTAPVDERLKALSGLVIAAPSATSAYTIPLRSAAEMIGLKLNLTYMSQPAMVAALQTGSIQGISAGAPFSLTPVLKGFGKLWISGPKGELPAATLPSSSACLQTTGAYAKAHPETIAAIRAVLADLAKLIHDDPTHAHALLAKAYPTLDPAVLAAAFAESTANWSQPVLTTDDIRHEIGILVHANMLPGVDKLDPAAALIAAG